MSSSKSGDGGEGPNLSVVGGTSTVSNAETETADKSLLLKLAELRQQHRELDAEILALTTVGPVDQLHLTRLKKRKLMLRDQITKVEDQIVPDIIA